MSQIAFSSTCLCFLIWQAANRAPAAFEAFRPAVVVLQCGADALSRDPLGDLNLGPDAYTSCVREVLSRNMPTLLLGGGGYHSANTARCYAAVTATVLSVRSPEDRQNHEEVKLDDSIPEHQYLPACMRAHLPHFQIRAVLWMAVYCYRWSRFSTSDQTIENARFQQRQRIPK